jgi:hypothetical protein
MPRGGQKPRDENRCVHVYRDTPKAREKGKVGQRCGMARVNETPYCKFHGGATMSTVDKYRRERVEAEIRQDPSFTELWPEDHPSLDPFSLLLWEIRRSGQRIEWFDRRLSELGKDRDIWWGVTKKEEVGAAEYTGVNKTFEARENVLVKMQNEERERLVKLRNEWQNNKFEAARIAGMGAFRTAMTAALRAVAAEFEIDLEDPAVQARLRVALDDLPVPIAAIEAQVAV